MKYCKNNSPYFLQDIPEFVLQSISPPNKGEWYAAVAIAKILDPNFQPMWSEEKEKGKMHKEKEKKPKGKKKCLKKKKRSLKEKKRSLKDKKRSRKRHLKE